jgi:hypothetical protein
MTSPPAEQHSLHARITACPPIFSGREPGVIERIEKDRHGTIYFVRLERYPGELMPFREQDLETECGEGGEHEWERGICVKCFEGKESNEN